MKYAEGVLNLVVADEQDRLTENERSWVLFLRLASNGRVPEPRLRDVQLIQLIVRQRLHPAGRDR